MLESPAVQFPGSVIETALFLERFPFSCTKGTVREPMGQPDGSQGGGQGVTITHKRRKASKKQRCFSDAFRLLYQRDNQGAHG